MGKKVGSILKVAAPLALGAIAPGIGSAIGGSILGAGAAGSATLGNALLGAGVSKLTGGNPLTGAITAGIGANLGSIGTAANPGSGILGAIGENVPGVYDLASGISGIGDAIGTFPGGNANPNGSGFLGKAASTLGLNGSPVTSAGVVSGNAAPVAAVGGGASSVASGGESGMFSKLLNKDNATLLGLGNSLYGNMQAQGALKKATGQANEALAPYMGLGSGAANKLAGYLGTGGTPASTAEILAASPGYKFMLEQGQQGLDRAQAARGGFFSGAALKAAQDYNAGLADQTAQNYYSQLAAAAGLGTNAANAYGNNVTALGTARGAGNISTANMINQILSGTNRLPWQV